MSEFVNQKVRIIAATQFYAEIVKDTGWEPDDAELFQQGGESLIEFAGRACYQSWNKPNPATATTAGYINHLLDVGHFSVLEHSSVSFYIEGVSRSLTHELVRHRHFAYSQLSQRYVDSRDTNAVMPPEAVGDVYLEGLISNHQRKTLTTYDNILNYLDGKLKEELPSTVTATERRKRARQTARAVLGNDTETKLVMTGNYRAWRHFIGMRATTGADTEIRALAISILKILKSAFPAVFDDYTISTAEDGTEIAATDKASEI